MYRLVFLTGKFKGRRLAVHQGSILIGRDPECHIHLTDDDEISRQHARLEERPEGVFIVDAGSLNKITVNDQETREAGLKPNDVIQLGKTRIQFQTVEQTVATERRRVGLVQRLTVASVALVLVLELTFLIGLSIWQPKAVTPPSLPVAVTQAVAVAEAPATAVTNTTPTPSEDSAVLEDAQARLNELEHQLAEPTNTATEVMSEMTTVSEEIRQLQEDVAYIRGKMQTLEPATNAPAPESTPAEPTEPPPPAIDPDALKQRAQEMLAEAQRLAGTMNLVQADQTLERIQILAPDFLPAYVERAQLLERRGLLKKAGEQWTLVMNKSQGTPLYQQAAAERIRIARTEMIQTGLKASSGRDDEASLSKLPRRVRILSIEHQKFPNNDQFEEMRLLRIALKVKPGEDEIIGNDIYVVVNFFDQARNSGQISLSGAVVPKNALTLDGQLEGGDQRIVTAAYIVPNGFRAAERAKQGEDSRFYGYTVRVLYRETLQDEDAKPRTLLRERIEVPNPPPAEITPDPAPVSETNSVQ